MAGSTIIVRILVFSHRGLNFALQPLGKLALRPNSRFSEPVFVKFTWKENVSPRYPSRISYRGSIIKSGRSSTTGFSIVTSYRNFPNKIPFSLAKSKMKEYVPFCTSCGTVNRNDSSSFDSLGLNRTLVTLMDLYLSCTVPFHVSKSP